MKSCSVGGFSSNEPLSSASTCTLYPAPRIKAASTWSWLRTKPPSGGEPESRGSRQWRMKAPVRTMALWPQNGPASPCHHALPVV